MRLRIQASPDRMLMVRLLLVSSLSIVTSAQTVGFDATGTPTLLPALSMASTPSKNSTKNVTMDGDVMHLIRLVSFSPPPTRFGSVSSTRIGLRTARSRPQGLPERALPKLRSRLGQLRESWMGGVVEAKCYYRRSSSGENSKRREGSLEKANRGVGFVVHTRLVLVSAVGRRSGATCSAETGYAGWQ